ncbi:hypothetical protein GCM10007350_00540 [Jeongeupia chitinilytica]|uniref:Uncharacterized protein n=1 Tax=Jeongeupia chitinilytica TaxID=1041641 RepID=A0ABQ3GW52_9NEIS|nr:hypothetical protein GCM10007350_00540 [Jeongeupia chitinilytica]
MTAVDMRDARTRLAALGSGAARGKPDWFGIALGVETMVRPSAAVRFAAVVIR